MCVGRFTPHYNVGRGSAEWSEMRRQGQEIGDWESRRRRDMKDGGRVGGEEG